MIGVPGQQRRFHDHGLQWQPVELFRHHRSHFRELADRPGYSQELPLLKYFVGTGQVGGFHFRHGFCALLAALARTVDLGGKPFAAICEINHNVGTTLIPSGGAAIVEFVCKEPGTYTIVDHSIFRAFNQGAMAQLVVTGPADKNIYSGKIADEFYYPPIPTDTGSTNKTVPDAAMPELSFADRFKNGQALFESNCSSCHQSTGLGLPGSFPPLAKSDFLMGRKDMGAAILLHGINNEPITVNGKHFQGVMPQLSLTDDQIASILTYVRNSWGNKGGLVKVTDVKKTRDQ